MSESDETLVVRSQRGDRAAFEELVRRVARLVFARIYLETANSHRSEDLAQETFLTAWRSIGQVTDPAGFRTWLLSIAHTTVIDAARRDGRKKRSGTRVGDEALVRQHASDPDPAQAAEAAEERDQVLQVLRSMPEEYRMPLTLRYISGADYETIGRQLGITNGSLRGLLNRGMQMMRSRLTAQEKTTARTS